MRSMTLFSMRSNLSPLPKLNPSSSSKILPSVTVTSRRRALVSTLVMPFFLNFPTPLSFPHQILDQEDNLVQLFKETSASVVFIKDLELSKVPKASSNEIMQLNEEEDAKVEGTGSGFIWDKYGHIVTNYHVVAKLATDTNGLQRCKVFPYSVNSIELLTYLCSASNAYSNSRVQVSLVDAKGNSFYREGKITGFDPAYDLAVLKVDVDGYEIKPAVLGQSNNLHVGQSCFAIGNPYGYENTLTTGVVSGLGREIPSPNGGAIKGAIQTDAPINAGNSGGPLIDSYGHVIGVNTATFTKKGTGLSSGVNFAIPIDTVLRSVPYLIVYGTPYSNRF
ncbi:hypothetical protein Lal_00037498 [Lupinus albus]|nr:hypothetical protein Lal_00037498 [Lupinus albus]